MAAGPELKEYRSNLREVLSDVRRLRHDTEALSDRLEPAATAAKNFKNFKEVVDTIDRAIDDFQVGLKVVDKAAPLKSVAVALERVLKKIEPKVEKIKEKVDKVDDKIGTIADALIKSKTVSDGLSKLLAAADEKLTENEDAVSNFVSAFDRIDGRGGRAPFRGLIADVDDELEPTNDLAESVKADFAAVSAEVGDLLDVLGISRFAQIAASMADTLRLEELFDGLSAVLNVANVALKPIEPLLDAVGAIQKIIVDPVLSFLIEAVGVATIFDGAAKEIEKLLPKVDFLDGFDANFDDLKSLVDDFEAGDFGTDDAQAFALEVLDKVRGSSDDGKAIFIGTTGADVLSDDDTPDVIDPRGGDDRVMANGGNDILIASEGDDVLDGGAGTDRLYFEGELVEYEFARNDAIGALIFTHVDPRKGSPNMGSETAVNIEFFDFRTETFTKQQLEEAIFGPSVLRGTRRDDLIFLNRGGDLVAGKNEAYGRGGDDRIQGTIEADRLFGGGGDDLLIPSLGEDELIGGGGSDTFQIFDLGFNTSDRVKLAPGEASVRGGRKSLAGVENVIIQHGGEVLILGNAANNELVSAEGRDILSGAGGDDILNGGAGEDFLFGGAGADRVYGGEHNDLLVAAGATTGPGRDRYDGGDGYDALSYSNDQSVLFDLGKKPTIDQQNLIKFEVLAGATAPGPLRIFTDTGRIERLDRSGAVVAVDRATSIEVYVGSDSADEIHGALGTYRDPLSVHGAGGDDTIFSNGASSVDGGGGDDRLIATLGAARAEAAATRFDGGGGKDKLDLRPVGDLRWNGQFNGAAGQSLRAFDADLTGRLGTGDPAFFTNVANIETYILSRNDDRIDFASAGRVVFRAGAGDDELNVRNGTGSKFVVMKGEAGDDTIRMSDEGKALGGLGDDRIEVNASGEQSARGNAGDDVIVVSRMVGALTGDRGYDTLIFTPPSGGMVVDLARGAAASLVTTPGQIEATGLKGFERVIGDAGDDVIRGDRRGETLIGQGGGDLLAGRDGDDRLYGGSGDDVISAGVGDDFLHGGLGRDRLSGGQGNDTASYAHAAPDGAEGAFAASGFGGVVVDLAAGTATGGGGLDTLISIENVIGTGGSDSLIGDGADNLLTGGDGDDLLFGFGGDDVLALGAGFDRAAGGVGRDTIIVGPGRAIIDGGRGVDWVDFSEARGGVNADLGTNDYAASFRVAGPVWADDRTTDPRSFAGANLTPQQVREADPLYSDSADDVGRRLPDSGTPDAERLRLVERSLLQASEGRVFGVENLRGSRSDDRLAGDDGDNRLDGDVGADVIFGRRGDDVLTGGRGRDIFVFRRDDGADRITDFDPDADSLRIKSGAHDFDDLDFARSGSDTILRFADVRIRFDDVRPRDLDASLFDI